MEIQKFDIDTIYKKYIDDLYAYARSMGFDKEYTMDAIHDVFYKLCIDPKLLSNINNIKQYLLYALRNKLLNAYKAQKKISDLPDETGHQLLPFNLYVTVEDEYILDEKDLINKKEIQKIFDTLTDRQREIIHLRYLQELEYSQIAEIMQIPIHSCRKMIYKTLLKIRKNNIPIYLLLAALV